jgi:lambda family phage tail tape measure protein
MAASVSERIYKVSVEGANAIKQLEKISSSASAIDQRFSKAANSISTAFSAIQRAAGALAAGAGVVAFGKSVLTASEQVINLQGSFQALLGDADRAADMLERVYDIVANTGVDFETAANSAQRLAVGLKEVGASNQQIQLIAENFIKLGRIGGSSIADIKGALLQFNQALASGRLQGDELRSISERLPGVIQLIAQEMGVSVGEVKKLGSEGKITSDILANSLLKATKEINENFALLPETFEQSVNKLKSTWDRFLIEVGKVSNIMEMVNVTIGYINKGLEDATKNTTAIGLIGGTLKTAFQVVAVLVSDVAFVVNMLVSDVARIGEVAGNILSGDFSKIPETWDKYRVSQGEARKELESFQRTIMGLEKASKPIRELNEEFEVLKPLLTAEQIAIKEMLDKIKESAGNMDLVQPKLAAIRTELDKLKESGQAGSSMYKALLEEQKKLTDSLSKGADKSALLTWAEGLKKSAEEIDLILPKMQVLAIEMEKLKAAGQGESSLFKTMSEEWKKLNELSAKGNVGAEIELQVQKIKEEATLTAEKMAYLQEAIAAAFAQGDIEGAEILLGIMDKLKTKTGETGDQFKKLGEGIEQAIANNANNAVNNFIDNIGEAELSFTDFATSVIKDIAKIVVQLLIMKPIIDSIKGYFGSWGGGEVGWEGGFSSKAFAAGGSFAGGTGLAQGVYSQPTLFKFAKGGTFGRSTGLMGEAGPEAIVPLKRTASGDLGVQASPVNVNVYNNAGVEVKTESSTSSDGTKQIDVYIERKVKDGIANGSYDRAFKGAYGLSRMGA